MTADRHVAAFDLDGTLTHRDTLIPWLAHVRGPVRTAIAFGAGFPRTAAALAGLGSRDEAKERLFRRLLAGATLAELQASVDGFVDRLVRSRVRPGILAIAHAHRAQGHELVIVSASPELYVDRVAAALGFDAGLGTRLEVDGDGRLTGRIQGRNCRGPEKVERLRAWLGGDAVVHAYGDSSGDRDLLALAGPNGTLVRRTRRLRSRGR